jgi:DNA modification methylase
MRNRYYSKLQSQELLSGFVSNVIEKLIEETSETAPASSIWIEVQNQIDNASPVRYSAKASRRERDAGLEGMPLVKTQDIQGRKVESAGSLNPAAGIGGGSLQSDGNTPRRNPHPTVKPISLTKWLATLLLPPDAYAPRRLLIPFCGSGSESIGAMLAGWEHIVGVELIDEYAEIARARLAWWEQAAAGTMFNDVKAILKAAKK